MSDESADTGGMSDGGGEGAPSEVSAAPEAPPPPAATGDAAKDAAAARRWSLKYEGQEREITDETELVTLAQRGLGADRRFEEAAAARKDAAAERAQLQSDARGFVQRLKDDPLGALSALEGDEGRAAQIVARKAIQNPRFRAQIERVLLEAYEYEGLPEDKRREVDARRELEAKAARVDQYEASERRARAEEAERQRQQTTAAETERLQATYAEEMRQSLTTAGLDPDDPDTAERWLMQRMAAVEHGVTLTAAEAAQRVADRVGTSRKGWLDGLGKLEGAALLEAIPPATLAKIRAAEAAKVTGKQVARSRASQAGVERPRPQAKPRIAVSPDRLVRAQRELGYAEANRRLEAGESLDRDR